MHKYEKLWLKVGISSLVIFLTILMITGLHNGHTPAASGRDYVNPDKVDQIEPFNKPGLHKVSGKDYDYELVILASAFNYQPGKVEITKGSKVKIIATSKDTLHGFSLPGTNVNMMLEPGHISEYYKTFNEKREYLVICNEYCGIGHADMKSMIKVVDKK
ncbi:cupredoxin domain-containing protein [Mammaliicoccus sciuri]|uniref:cytochrome B5 n=1 Tax=Mammaliicoccus sciuri TaxID=1296 RepID=UPI000733F9D1|nr:cytochrome B5 [Mammaliicoccus sciuri]KTT84377.1 cytochrome B5 [Mammaliicoccus sciuri]MBA1396494.1 cytochrome B5 [Mammaliicoccus sciuri]MBG9205164.1 cytochrome B5 [Mammaliicoccus sciuri]MCC2087757.1 cytochrome B5 [Mammaliicoccus sciuri]MCH5139958.1 cytochrome B5 [Mammaliicoccus sciuri]